MVAQAGLFVARDSGGNGTTPQGARAALAGLLAKSPDGTVRVGVLADGQGPVVTGAAGMSYNVRKHVAVTKATEANGPVLVPNDGTVSVATDPAPGSNSRIDVIYVWQRLVTGDGGSETTVAPVIDVAKGAASASPSAPTIPSGALELGRATVTAGATATSGLTFTQGATTAPATEVQAIRSSTFTIPPGTKSVVVPFPRPFADVPVVSATLAAANIDVVKWTLGAVTTTQATIILYNSHPTFTAPSCVLNVMAMPVTS